MTTRYEDRFGGADVVDAQRGMRDRLADGRLWRAVGAAALLGVLLAGVVEYWFVSPLAASRDAREAERSLLADANRANEATLVDYREFLAGKADVDRRFEAATTAIPTDAEMATVLESIRALATESKMQLVSFTPDPPKPSSGAALEQRRARVLVRGGFEDLRALVRSLGDFPRTLTVESITVKQASQEGFTAEAAIALTCYFKQSPPEAG